MDLETLKSLRQRAPKTPWHVEYLGAKGYPQRISNETATLIAELFEGVEPLTYGVSAPTAEYIVALVNAAPDLFAEVGRLHGVEFIHRGCEMLRVKDNAVLIEQRDEARAERDRLGRQQQALLALCANAEATGRLIHHGQVHDLLITDPGDAA